jgi:predicted dehydrogenase
MVRYLINAGPLAPGSWYAQAETEGSRFEGEGGHFIDTVSWWLGATPVEAHAVSAAEADNVLVTLRFDEGSVASLDYATRGNPRYPKETIEVVADGRIARLDNFRKAMVWKGRRAHTQRARGSVDKGQHHQLDRFLAAVRTGDPMPISLTSLAATTRATLAVSRSQASGRSEAI